MTENVMHKNLQLILLYDIGFQRPNVLVIMILIQRVPHSAVLIQIVLLTHARGYNQNLLYASCNEILAQSKRILREKAAKISAIVCTRKKQGKVVVVWKQACSMRIV